MKKILIAACVLTISSMSVAAEKYMINPAETKIQWMGSKSLIDSKHEGTVELEKGYFEFEKGKLQGGEFVVDMSTIKNDDVKDPEYNQKLVGHLKSDDFFDVQAHPTANFKITKVIPTKKKNTYDVVGDLTIKGITKEHVVKNVKVDQNKETVVVEPSISVDRKEYGITYNAQSTFEKITDSVKDKVIADEFTLDLKLVASAPSK